MSRRYSGGVGRDLICPEETFDLAFHARISTFRDQREMRVEWLDARYEEVVIEEKVGELPFEVVDLRGVARPQEKLAEITSRKRCRFGRKVQLAMRSPVKIGPKLCPAEVLAIYTLPPDRATLYEGHRKDQATEGVFVRDASCGE